MNLLAHAFLSFHDEDILLGNMIGDDIKGKQKNLYPPKVRQGIMLHRYIDSYTDQHPVILEAKKVYSPLVGLYSGAFVDISFDYFLARDLQQWTEEELKAFSQWVYQTLAARRQWQPEKFRHFSPYMQSQDMLYHYRFMQNIEKSLENLLLRTKLPDKQLPIAAAFQSGMGLLKSCYGRFFPELKTYARHSLDKLQATVPDSL